MSQEVQVAVASGSEDLIPTLIQKMRAIRPDLPLYLISEFRVEGTQWIPYHLGRTPDQNLALCRSVFAGKRIRLVGLILQPRMPYWSMRWLGWKLGGLHTLFFNENLDHFMLRPRSLPVMARHIAWRTKNFVRWELRPGGATYTFLWRLLHPKAFLRPWRVFLARLAGELAASRRNSLPYPGERRLQRANGVSVVIPSRNGRELLERLLPGLLKELGSVPLSEVIVVDNGSNDGTERFLKQQYPQMILESHSEPLSFAQAVNLGIGRARLSHVLLLNNDMVLETRFFAPLLDAFQRVPDLFCATAQILFPPGVRREETGKAVMPSKTRPEEFPVSCAEPVLGENLSYVLYGSGGCSLYDAAKLEALGRLREIFVPAYVEDLDLGYRAWQRGWPSVFVSGAKLEHRHRATTSRYFSVDDLAVVLEVNYLRFLAHSVSAKFIFRKLWRKAIDRLNHRAARMQPDFAAQQALARAARIAIAPPPPTPAWDEEKILAIGSGDVAVFPGRATSHKPTVLVASPYVPFPLSHGGAVRMFNLMTEAARDFDQVLVCFTDEHTTPPLEILDLCVEVVTIRREGSHRHPLTDRPDVVEEFDVLAFHAALELTLRKWRPCVAQLEFTQMAVYAPTCGPVATVLVEHDITLDLYRQLLDQAEDWETRQQYDRWVSFETKAWEQVDAIVAMSEKDRQTVASPKAVTLANGVDLDRFTPSDDSPESGRILFIGSFAHLPNVLAIEFFLREVWRRVRAEVPATLHVIAGARHRYYLERYRDRADPRLDQPGIDVEDFVSDPRPAYRRASVVIAPLLASAGTNIKIMEAMAMGKAIVSTPAGINGLADLRPGIDLLVEQDPGSFAGAIVSLLNQAERRRKIERSARVAVEQRYGWGAIGRRQRDLYDSLRAGTV